MNGTERKKQLQQMLFNVLIRMYFSRIFLLEMGNRQYLLEWNFVCANENIVTILRHMMMMMIEIS